MPTSIAFCSSTAFSSAYFRTSSVIFIEQKCGPHIEQKCDVFAASCGRVSSWNDLAVSESSERLNRSEEHTSELQSPCNLVCRLLLEKKNKQRHHYSQSVELACAQ